MSSNYFFPDEIPGGFSILPRRILSFIQLSRPHHFMAGVIPCLCGVQFSNNATDVLYWYFVFIIGAFLILGAGETINDILDMKIDAKYFKTMARPLPSGQVKLNTAILYFFSQLFGAFLIWLLLPNTVKLMTLGELIMICLYPFFKRFSYVTQIYLGMIPGLSVIFPYYVFENHISLGITFLCLGCAMTCIIFDTTFEYAEYFSNPKTEIKSIAFLFKNKYRLYLNTCIFIHVLFLVLAGIYEPKSFVFIITTIISGTFMYHTIKKTDFYKPDECRRNFLKLQFSNIIVLLGVILSSTSF